LLEGRYYDRKRGSCVNIINVTFCRVVSSKGIAMDQNTPIAGSLTGSGSRSTPASANPASAKVQDAARAVYQTTDNIADRATTQIDHLSGTAHRAVNSAADAASSAAEWASTIPEQAKQAQAQLTEAASASIRARPIATVVGTLVIGYMLGRLGHDS
jgi:hypothetical protein